MGMVPFFSMPVLSSLQTLPAQFAFRVKNGWFWVSEYPLPGFTSLHPKLGQLLINFFIPSFLSPSVSSMGRFPVVLFL